MKPTKTLIAALYSAADRIEKDETYSWFDADSCNCGILAQELLLTDKLGICDIRWDHCLPYGTWAKNATFGGFCNDTGLPLKEIFRRLSQFGLEKADYALIEGPDESPREETANRLREMAVALEVRRSNGEKP